MKDLKTVGIIGGMGPAATADIFSRIIHFTPSDKDTLSDKEHLPIIVFNIPQIPSRVKAILRGGPSPLPMMIDISQRLEQAGADFIVVPCNTACHYVPELRESINIPILNIVDETVNYLAEKHPNIKKIGLLATEATLRTGIYQEALLKKEIEIVNYDIDPKVLEDAIKKINKLYYNNFSLHLDSESPDNIIDVSYSEENKDDSLFVLLPQLKSLRKKVTKALFGKRGIKAGYFGQSRILLESATKELEKRGAQAVIMGCTEIPLVLKQKNVKTLLINPNDIIAKIAVQHGKNKS
jgi:aspartate racemase